jgi:hypothetical protein
MTHEYEAINTTKLHSIDDSSSFFVWISSSYYLTSPSLNSYNLLNSIFCLIVPIMMFAWWLFNVAGTVMFSAIKYRHMMNALLRYIILLFLALSMCKLPVGVNGAFSRSAKLLAKDGASSDGFGHGVSVYGATAMIGAFGDDDKTSDAGISNLLQLYLLKLICGSQCM